jgi:hypothetical protein
MKAFGKEEAGSTAEYKLLRDIWTQFVLFLAAVHTVIIVS